MRIVAVAMALLVLPFASVEAANELDECGQPTDKNPCVDYTLTSPHPSAPVKAKRYFLWLGWANCGANVMSEPTCRATSNSDHKTPTRPVDNPHVPDSVAYPFSPVLGTFYEDTNGLEGLQRFRTVLFQKEYPPDRIVLV